MSNWSILYTEITRLKTRMLMPRLLSSTGHQQIYYCRVCRTIQPFFSSGTRFNYPCLLNVENERKWHAQDDQEIMSNETAVCCHGNVISFIKTYWHIHAPVEWFAVQSSNILSPVLHQAIILNNTACFLKNVCPISQAWILEWLFISCVGFSLKQKSTFRSMALQGTLMG